jgi:hypothetical protein
MTTMDSLFASPAWQPPPRITVEMTIGKTGFHLRLRSDLLCYLRLVARREDVTMTSIIEAALENYLASRPDMT